MKSNSKRIRKIIGAVLILIIAVSNPATNLIVTAEGDYSEYSDFYKADGSFKNRNWGTPQEYY